MAKMIDLKPEYHGEAKLWSSLEAYLPENIIVYNNREVNGREYDFCLLIEGKGILIIEVKGWISDKIKVMGVDQIIVDGYETPQRSPKKQARMYRFALLNKIVGKYNVSPLVYDLVCYPFISKEEYKRIRLDIVCEDKFVLFKEDIEDPQRLLRKIEGVYEINKNIPHAEFTKSFIAKLRQDWEPGLEKESEPMNLGLLPYSLLQIIPDQLSEEKKKEILTHYFNGVKCITFIGDRSSFNVLVGAFCESLKKKNIGVKNNNLKIGSDDEIKISENSFRTFNFEIYYHDQISSLCSQEIVIEEGRIEQNTETSLKKIAGMTGFNLEQYRVEHASVCANTLVQAGAGTGKTYSMVSRVAYLCNKKDNPINNIAEEVALVTFTNDAARNMKVRLKQMFVNYFILTADSRYLRFIEDIDRSHISTIHKFALEILKKSSLYTGLGTNFRISSDEYARGYIYEEYLSDFLRNQESENSNFIHEIPVPVYELKKKIVGLADRLLAKSINVADIKKSEMGTPVENTIPYFNDIIEKVIIPAEIDYLNSRKDSDSIDLKECIILLDLVLDRIGGKLDCIDLKYLFIDEFQDTDDVQIRVFQRIQKAMHHECKLFVVGDLKQSIYRFRGAKLSAFDLLLEGSQYEWEKYFLRINYRSDRRLLEKLDVVFSTIGSHDYLPYKAKEDRLVGFRQTPVEEDNLFVCVPCHAKDEDAFIDTVLNTLQAQVAELSKMIEKRELSREERTIAILVRTNRQVDNIVNAARKTDFIIETQSGGNLFQLESSVDLYKLVSALENGDNPVNMVDFIESNYTGLKLDYQRLHGLRAEEKRNILTEVLDQFFMLKMNKTWEEILIDAGSQPILFVLKQIFDSLAPWKQYSNKTEEQKYYIANYEYLLERIIKYSRTDTLTLNQIYQYLKINITTRQQQQAREKQSVEEGIHILCTTIHKSKGLEYGTVILPYTYTDISDIRRLTLDANYSNHKLAYIVMFENKIKERNSNYDLDIEVEEQISEESRILYVALTRAIRNCVWIDNLDANPSISWGTMMEVL